MMIGRRHLKENGLSLFLWRHFYGYRELFLLFLIQLGWNGAFLMGLPTPIRVGLKIKLTYVCVFDIVLV